MDIDEMGAAVRAARKKQQWTQAELSTMLGMSRATLSAFENGKINELGIRKVMALCSILGLELVVQDIKPKRPTLQYLVSEAEQRKRGAG